MPGYSNKRLIPLVYPFCFLIPLLYLFSGCASSENIYNKLSDTEYTSSDYRTVLDRWTRRGLIHKGLKTGLLIVATHKAGEFRRAYTEEYARVYMVTQVQNKIMMDAQIRAADDYDDFLAQPKPSKSIGLILTSAPGATVLKWEL